MQNIASPVADPSGLRGRLRAPHARVGVIPSIKMKANGTQSCSPSDSILEPIGLQCESGYEKAVQMLMKITI